MADLCPNGFKISQLINLVRIYTPPKSGSHPIDPDCVVARETSPLSYSLTARSAVAKHPQVCTKGRGWAARSAAAQLQPAWVTGPGCVSAKTANNVGCIGDATIFSIFQYYMCRDNSILRRRAARSAVARRQLPWVMGPGYVLCAAQRLQKM